MPPTARHQCAYLDYEHYVRCTQHPHKKAHSQSQQPAKHATSIPMQQGEGLSHKQKGLLR